MNKRFTFLCALVLFGAAFLGYAADEVQPQPDSNPIVQQDIKNDNPVVTKENSVAKVYWGKFTDFYGKHKTAIRWVSGSIVALYFGHKVLYCCSTDYKNWVNGADADDSEESKLPWRTRQ